MKRRGTGLHALHCRKFLEQVRHRSRETVNRLVGVAHRKQADAGVVYETYYHPVQCESQILIFIHGNDRKPRLQTRPDPLVSLNQPKTEQHHVVEINCPALPQFPFVDFDHLRRFRIIPEPLWLIPVQMRPPIPVEVGAQVGRIPVRPV